MVKKLVFMMILLLSMILAGTVVAQGPGGGPPPRNTPSFDPNYQGVTNTYVGFGTVTQGEFDATGSFDLPENDDYRGRYFEQLFAEFTSDTGDVFVVPFAPHTDGALCSDIFNDFTGNGAAPNYADNLETIVLDPDGEVITATLFGDNYFELYINGEFVCRDAIGFVPFNSHIVRFQATYPMTVAVRLLDGETHLGIGMEYDEYNIGDAGFIAQFDNGLVTGADWKCRPYYIAPLDDPACVVEDELGNRDSSACGDRAQCATQNADVCRALHYPVPEDWASPDFDDSEWNTASLYTADRVTNQRAYADYTSLWSDADFIWTSNLDLDNQVLCRITIEAPLSD